MKHTCRSTTLKLIQKQRVFAATEKCMVKLSITSRKTWFNKFCKVKMQNALNEQLSSDLLYKSFSLSIRASKCAKRPGNMLMIVLSIWL